MAYEVKLLSLAENDIDEICQYLSQFYPGTPGRFLEPQPSSKSEGSPLDALEKEIENISINPNMFPKYEYDKAYRKMVFGNFLAFYKTDESNNQVYIYRVLNGKRSVDTILKELESK